MLYHIIPLFLLSLLLQQIVALNLQGPAPVLGADDASQPAWDDLGQLLISRIALALATVAIFQRPLGLEQELRIDLLEVMEKQPDQDEDVELMRAAHGSATNVGSCVLHYFIVPVSCCCFCAGGGSANARIILPRCRPAW